MAGNNSPFRLTVDRSEFDEAVAVMRARRDLAPPLVRAEIDRAIADISSGRIPDERLIVSWQEKLSPGHDLLNVTAGAILLDLALPSTEITLRAPLRLRLRETIMRALATFRRKH